MLKLLFQQMVKKARSNQRNQRKIQGGRLILKNGPHICYNSAKSYVGKNVNLHLKGGNTLINVTLEGIEKKLLLIRGNKSLSLIHISEPTRLRRISYAVFCL